MNNLPGVIYFQIFKDLNLLDLIKLKLVSKNIHYWVSVYKVKSLSVCHIPYKSIKLSLFYRQLNKRILSNLKDLKLILKYQKFDFNDLNSLSTLENLKIKSVGFYPFNNYCSEDQKLILPKLKFLSLKCCSFYPHEGEKLNLSIKTIDLVRLRISNFKAHKLKFEYPQNIIHLEADDCFNLYEMIGIEDVAFSYPSSFEYPTDVISNNFLSRHPRLKKVNFNSEQMEICLMELINQRKKAQRNNLKIYFLGVEIMEMEDMKNIRHLKDNDLPQKCVEQNLMVKNLKLISNFDLIKQVDYGVLKSQVPKFPSNYLDELKRVSQIYIRESIEDSDHFGYFIERLWQIKESSKLKFYLKNGSLGQSFFNNLSKFSSITALYLSKGSIELNLNYEFLKKLKNLRVFSTFEQLPTHIIQWFMNDDNFNHDYIGIYFKISSELEVFIEKYYSGIRCNQIEYCLKFFNDYCIYDRKPSDRIKKKFSKSIDLLNYYLKCLDEKEKLFPTLM